MEKLKNMEEAYQAYLQHPEKEIVYEGIRYFRIIYKTGFHINGVWTMFVTIPLKMVAGKKLPIVAEDVLGEKITITAPAHFSFRNGIPDWYMDTLTFSIPHIPDVDWYLGVPNEAEMLPEQMAQEKELQELAPIIVAEIANTKSVKRPEGVEEWDGGIDINHRWQFSSEAERIAVLRAHYAQVLNRNKNMKDRSRL